MSILITGAGGIVGMDLVKILADKYQIVGFYRSKNSEIKKIKNVKWVKQDLRNNIKKINPNPKYIIHCAVDQKYLGINKKKYVSLNEKIIKNLINYFQNYKKDGIFINLSSIEVYGRVKKKILNEDYNPINQNMYGLMKYKCEKILENSNINYVNLRLPGVLCSFSKKIRHRPWINSISYKFLKNEDVYIYNPKSKFNNLISTDELKKIIFKIIKIKVAIKKNFNIGSSNPLTLEKMTNIMKKTLKSRSSIIIKKTNKLSFLISKNKIEKFLNHKIGSTQNIIRKHLLKKVNSQI